MEDVGLFDDFRSTYFTAIFVDFIIIWYILWQFGIFFPFWYVVLTMKKSGNPAHQPFPANFNLQN
jgi:hypothetical protein